MTRDSVRGRGAGPIERGSQLQAASLVAALIVAGIVLRFVVAWLYLPLSGLRVDVGDFAIWAHQLAQSGPGAFYGQGGLTDYPPGYMYVLWLIGSIGRWLQSYTVGVDITPGLIKVPGILADGGVAWLLFAYCRRFGDGWLGRWSGERLGVVAVAIWLFNPGTIFNSSVWGQIDSVGALVLLASLYALARGWTEAAAAGAVLAMLVKFQFAFLLPVVAVVGIKRHLLGRSSDPEQTNRADPLRVLTSLAAGLGTLVGLIIPFGLGVWAPGDDAHSLINKFQAAADLYKGLTINAMNLWRNPWSGLSQVQWWGCDSPSTKFCGANDGVAMTIGSTVVTWQLVGAILFGIVAIVALLQVARRDDPAGLLTGSLLLAVAFFALPTRVHERYLFPALALAAPLVARSWRSATIFGALSFIFFANIYWVYTHDWSFVQGSVYNPGVGGAPMVRDPFLAATLFSPIGVYAVSFLVVVLVGVLTWRSVAMALAPARRRWQPAGASPTVPVLAGGVPSEPMPPGLPATPPPSPATPIDGARTFDRLRVWLRRDPTDPYRSEPFRRLDRIDALLVVALVLFSFVFRIWRLDLPRSTTFDEVYHGRSATEWLADWQEGWKRDTYEWTHPPLAKFLIAGGIVLANPNQLQGTWDAPLDSAVSSIVVAPKRTAYGRPASVAFTAGTDDEVTARDAQTGAALATWNAPGAVASLAWDEDNNRLFVGLSASGTVAVYGTDEFLASTGERAPPPQTGAIETGLSAVDQIVVPESDPIVAFRGPDGVMEVERSTLTELASSKQVFGGITYVPPAGSSTASRIVGTDPGQSGIVALDGATLQPDSALLGTDGHIPLPSAPIGPLLTRGSGNSLQVWVPVGPLPADIEHGPLTGGMSVFDEGLNIIDTVPLPGAPRLIGWNDVANIIYAAGIEQKTGGPVVWTINPLGSGGVQSAGFATFDTTILPGEPLAMAFDISDHSEADDHERLLVSTQASNETAVAEIDVGSNTFAWRLASVIFGSLLTALIYLLAATLFPRRRIAVLAAIFIAVDGMSYAMSRIAMNDIFVATFIAAAYLLYWQIWSGRWARSAWWVLPTVGVLIGLAAATKWVGFYALAGLWILTLARSHFGRFLLVAMIGFLTVATGIGAPWPFVAICLMALALALFLVWHRPVRLSPADLTSLAPIGVIGGGIGLAFAIAYPMVEGRTPKNAVELVFAVLARGAQAAWPAYIMLAVAGLLLIARGWRSMRHPETDRRWLLPGEMGGFAWPWIGACLLVIPLFVYFLSWVPYLQLGHGIATEGLGPGYGWSLDELHSQAFGFHFGLTAGHPASSPWWSWPLDLKTVFFYTHSFDDRQLAVVYNGGNPILFWAGVPAILLAGVMAWKRRSPALVMVVAAFAFQLVPWARIERAVFQYHYFTALLFAMIAVAYFVDEGLRRWDLRPLAIAFLVAAAIAGVLVFPLNSALAMPDWYISAARALPPWNYAFVFPSPSQGPRAQLLSADTWSLGLATVLSLGAAAFALFGRDWFEARRRAASGGGALPQGGDQQEDAKGDEPQRPEAVDVERRQILPRQEVEPQPHEDQPEDEPGGA
ncbi:MAG: phospholipid carrier-dependent glycosyltransferase [Chloroflexi bacterium]|nr:MAG: phospholipid carrier-dependent glycosyltransferase [Chloroflexota bacterium]